MASSFLKGLVTDYGKLGYQLWHRPLKMASLVYEREIGGGDLVFCFTFNLAGDLRTKMALTLEILSDQMHRLPRNSAEHTLLYFFASFRRFKSALCHLLCEATCSLRTDKQLGNNVTSVDEYSKIVTVQQLGDRIMHIMHISRLKHNNRPFYSCELSYLAMNASEAGVELALIQTSLLFSCKCKLVSIRTTWFAQ